MQHFHTNSIKMSIPCYLAPLLVLTLGLISGLSADYGTKDLVRCNNFDDCRAACGPSASHFKCHSNGYCSCLNTVGYPAKCEKLNPNDSNCSQMCGQIRISKRCATDAGLFCTCFQHPYYYKDTNMG